MDSDGGPVSMVDPIRAHAVVEALEKRLGIPIERRADTREQLDLAYEEGEPPD
jgi:hypothetical protein